MNKEEQEKVLMQVAGLSALYDKELSEEALKLYLMAFDDIDFDDIMRAIAEVVKQNKFFPKPSEIRELTTTGSSQPFTPQRRALVAWAELRNIGGTDKTPPVLENDDCAMAAFRAMGGRRQWGSWDVQYDNVYVKQFVEFYMAFWAKANASHTLALKDGQQKMIE